MHLEQPLRTGRRLPGIATREQAEQSGNRQGKELVPMKHDDLRNESMVEAMITKKPTDGPWASCVLAPPQAAYSPLAALQVIT